MKCKFCKKEFKIPKIELFYSKDLFCSKECEEFFYTKKEEISPILYRKNLLLKET